MATTQDNTIRIATNSQFCLATVFNLLHAWADVLAISPCSGAENEHFVYSEADYSIRRKASPKTCVEADSLFGLRSRERLSVAKCDGASNKQFVLNASDSTLRMKTKPSLCLGIVGTSVKANARLELLGADSGGCVGFTYSAAASSSCVCVSGTCTVDPRCLTDPSLIGCGAEGMAQCRFCGFGRFASVVCAATPAPAPTPGPSPSTWVADLEHWQSIFDAPTEAGSNEGRQYYNADPSQTSFYDSRRGGLVLRAMRSTATAGFAYAAPWLQSKRGFGIGTYTWVATVPKGLGLWPAMWMVPASQTDGQIACRYTDANGHCTWPVSGEIDVFETVNDASYVWQTLHMGKHGTGGDVSISQYPNSGHNRQPVGSEADDAVLSSQWWAQQHTYQFVRHDGYLQWLIDGKVTQTITQTQLDDFLTQHNNRPSSYGSNPMAPFDHSSEFNLILNIAVGGRWPCADVSCGAGGRGDAIPQCPVNDAPADLVIHSITFEPHHSHT